MNKELWNLDIGNLNALYEEELKQLEQNLLGGAAWEEVGEQRRRVGELATILYKKSNPAQFGNPAENGSRNDASCR